MSKISCKKLSILLNESGLFDKPFDAEQLRNRCEAFGRDVRCFIYLNKEQTNKVRQLLLNSNVTMMPWRCGVSVGVTYFKAWHWDE